MTAISIVVTIREIPSCSVRTLRTLLERTPGSAEIIYVAYGVGSATLAGIKELFVGRSGKILEGQDWIPQNAARNLGARHVRIDSEFIVFIDNDVTVEPGWLEPLVECAVETGAGIVGPMILEGDPAKRIVHMTGGVYREIETRSGKAAFERHINWHRPLASLTRKPVRAEVDYVEGHCILVSRRVLTALNGWDEGLISAVEYMDLCLCARANGVLVFVEPASVVTYGDLGGMTVGDAPQFFRRWNVAESLSTFDHFVNKRGLRGDCELVVYGQNFVREHRGRIQLFDSSLDWARPAAGGNPPPPQNIGKLLVCLRSYGYSISGINALEEFCDAVFPSMLDHELDHQPGALIGLRAAHLLACDGAQAGLIAAALIYPLLRSGQIPKDRGVAILKDLARHWQFSDLNMTLNSIHALESNVSLVQGDRFLSSPIAVLRSVAILAALMGARGPQTAPPAFAEALDLLRSVGFQTVAGASVYRLTGASVAAE